MFFLTSILSLSNVLSSNININIDKKTGLFDILINKQRWFSSNEVSFMSNGILHSTNDNTLLFQDIKESIGSDSLGDFNLNTLQWKNNQNELLIGNIKTYQNWIVFEQVFPDTIKNTSTGNADSIVSNFPSFQIFDDEIKRGYAHWDSWYYPDAETNKVNNQVESRKLLVAPGFPSPLFGEWNSTTILPEGIGGTGVNCIFNEDASISVVISPLNNFMVWSHTSPQPGILNHGIMGNVTEIPSKFSLKTIMYVGEGINSAMKEWGTLLRGVYGKSDLLGSRSKDITLQYLGYNTDNGAYYYYNTVPNMNYEETLIEVKKYSDSIGIPYTYVLLDSWWYYKGENGGVSEWAARPDIFPSGVEAVYSATGWLMQAHNRYWSSDTPYAKQNGGKFDFIFDEKTGGAVPTEQEFWDYLLGYETSKWGLRVYEQDWLFNEFYEYVDVMLESVSLGRMWLLQMGRAASKYDLTIQYCMPYTRHLMQSLEVASVTQARASDDYKPGEDFNQWRIGGQNILLAALGLAPSKDAYWSTSYQPGNPYGEDKYEPIPARQAVVTILSTGPVAIGDGINYSDSELIMKSCRKDGRLLNPTVPSFAIDKSLIKSAIPSTFGPEGEVWVASTIKGSRIYSYVFVSDLANDWTMIPSDIGLNNDQIYRIFESSTPDKVTTFSKDSPVTLKQCGENEFSLWIVVPIEKNGLSLLGEINKWVTVSEARFNMISSYDNYELIETEIYGVEGEKVTIGFVGNDNKVFNVECTFSSENSNEEHLTMVVDSTGKCSF